MEIESNEQFSEPVPLNVSNAVRYPVHVACRHLDPRAS